MGSYVDRNKIQITGGTAAVRATITLGLRELWIDVDGGGVPTGDLWIGDGSTLGGVKLTLSGNQTIGGTLTVEGTLTAEATAVLEGLSIFTGQVQLVSTGPNVVPFNSASSNADGSRSSLWQAGGHKADATQHWLAWAEVEHDGSGDDERGRVIIRMNRAETGLGTPAELLRIDDHLKVQGDLRAFSTRRTHRINGASTAIASNPSWTDIPFATNGRTDAGFTWNGSFTECTVGFDGEIEIGYDITARNDDKNNTRAEGHWKIQRDTGGGFALLSGSYGGSYHRGLATVPGWASASCRPLIVAVSNGDKFKVQGSNYSGGSLVLMSNGCRVTLRRVAGALP